MREGGRRRTRELLLLSAAMDSGNSGSLQSSSGGDDDFDSRGGGVDSSPLSALLRPAPSPSAAGAFSMHGSLYGLQDFTSAPPQQQQQQHHQQQQASWSAQFMAGPASSSTRVPPADAGMGASAHQAPDPSAAAATAPPRGSRKRARASRRAPTTVLTTDTSNFRAMVQEFTGFPAPPPFAAPPRLRPGGVLVSTAPTRYHFKLPFLAASQTYPPSGTTSNSTSCLVLNALAMFAKNNGATSAAASGASTPSSGSDLYRSYGPVVSGAAPFDDGVYEVEAAAEGQMVCPGVGRLSPPLHGEDWCHRH